jgi:hypothetical protein
MNTALRSRVLVMMALGCAACAEAPADEPAPGAAPDQPGANAAGDQAIAVEARALTDSFSTNPPALVRMASDGGDRILVAWEGSSGGSQIVGQVFSASTGAPLSPSRIYTTGTNTKGKPFVAYGGGKFLITYIATFSTSDTDGNDNDVRGIFVRPDGTKDSELSVDLSFADDAVNGGLVYLPTLNQFYSAYYRNPRPNRPEWGGRGAYIDLAGAISKQGYFAGVYQSMFPRVAYGNNNITLIWTAPNPSNAFRDNVLRGHMRPGDAAVQASVIIGQGDRPFIAYNATLGKFGMGYREYWNGNIYRSLTVPDGCLGGSCGGISPLQPALDPGRWSMSNPMDGEIVAAGSRFVLGVPWGGQTGAVATMSLDTNGWPLIMHTNALESTCYRPIVAAGATVGNRALFGANMSLNNCPGIPKLKGVYFADQSGRDSEFPISD